jgi:hypothetical protein
MLTLGHLLDGTRSLLATAVSLTAALAIAKAALDWWRRGPGRRRRWRSLFAQLALQVRVDYVIDMFGEPTYRQYREGGRFKASNTDKPEEAKPEEEVATFTEHVWLLASDGYLQVLTDDLNNVVRYSLTTRNRKFHPNISIGAVSGGLPRFSVRLGRTLFSELPAEPGRVYRGPYGATAPYEYRQSYYYGRGGGYADWTCTYNAAGLTPVDPLPFTVPVPPWAQALSARGWLADLDDEQRNSLSVSRAGTVVNTVTIEDFRSDRTGKIHYGPDRELVRLMPSRATWWERVSFLAWRNDHHMIRTPR